METPITDGDKALAATTCKCKAKVFGDDCAIDCTDPKFKGDGIDTAKRCNCADNTFYNKDATVCAITCDKVPNSSAKTDKSGCECNTGYLGDAKTECKKCPTASAAASCLCKATHTGDNCETKVTADANAFM